MSSRFGRLDMVSPTDPRQGTVNTVSVPNCDDYLRKVESAGGKTVVPKMGIPGVGWLAYCSDPEGNTFGIMQNDPNVAAAPR